MRVPDSVGVGMAKVTIAFDAWKEGKVASTKHEIAVVLPKKLDFKLVDVSPGIRKELVHPNKTRSSWLVDIRFSPDGKRLIAGDYPGGVVETADVETGKCLTTIETGKGNRSSSHYFLVSPDWRTLFVNRPGARKLERLEKDGKQLLKSTYDGAVLAWDLDSGKLRRTYRHDPPRWVFDMSLSPDGAKFVTFEVLPGTDRTGASSLWDARTGKFIDLGRL